MSSKKLSNKHLLIILVILLLPIVAWKVGKMINPNLFESLTGERNFRSEIIEIDTAKVSDITIYPKSHHDNPVHLFVKDDAWKVTLNNDKSITVPDAKVDGLLQQLIKLKPKRLAAKTESRWHDLQVDSTGSRVVIKEGPEETLDIVFGKFSYEQGNQRAQATMETYVRLKDEKETYTVDGFLDPYLNNDASYWRDKTIIKGKKEDWVSLTYNLPAFGSYKLQLKDSVWVVDDKVADKQAVDSYLSSISNLNGNKFVDDVPETALGAPDYTLVLENKQGDQITVEGFVKDDKEIISSSQNPENLLDAKNGKLFEKVFVGKPKFFPEEQAELEG